jgi:hypothetical protein
VRRSNLAAIIALLLSGQSFAGAALAQRDLAFEAKSLQWMKQTRQADEAIKAGKYPEAEGLLKSIIADRINYNLDLSSERGSLAHVYEAMGKNDQAEALYKINLKTREAEDGPKGYTLEYPLNEYAGFLDKVGRKDEAKAIRDRAAAIETAANKEGEELEKKEKQHTSHKKGK